MAAGDKGEFVFVHTATLVAAGEGPSATNRIIRIATPVPSDALLPKVEAPKLVILKYEFEMYFLMRSMRGYEGPLQDAITESAVVHARALCNFFCGFDEDGDIRLNQLFNKREEPLLSALIKKLKSAYNRMTNGVNPRTSFNKFVVHMTIDREKNAGGYDYHREFDAIDPVLRQIRDDVVRPLLEEAAASASQGKE